MIIEPINSVLSDLPLYGNECECILVSTFIKAEDVPNVKEVEVIPEIKEASFRIAVGLSKLIDTIKSQIKVEKTTMVRECIKQIELTFEELRTELPKLAYQEQLKREQNLKNQAMVHILDSRYPEEIRMKMLKEFDAGNINGVQELALIFDNQNRPRPNKEKYIVC